MATIRCDIVCAEEEIFHGEATMVVATGEEGELGIAPRHAALITRLKPGQVRVLQENGEELFFYVSGGILEVQPSVVTVLADTALRAKDLDEAAARTRQGRSRAHARQPHRRARSRAGTGAARAGGCAVAGAGAAAAYAQALSIHDFEDENAGFEPAFSFAGAPLIRLASFRAPTRCNSMCAAKWRTKPAGP